MPEKTNTRMKYIFILILSIASISSLHSQALMRHYTTKFQPVDSLDLKKFEKKNGLRAGAEVFSVNMVIWSFNRYILNKDDSRIGFNSFKNNFKKGFYWDNDQMSTNMFAHPYHGSLYFNAARSNNMNFWESSLYALGGSAMWELFMESEIPSTNDIMATPFGGMALGEVLFRASDLAIDETTRGWERFKHEAIAFLISPSRGLTRILTGEAWKVRGSKGRQFGVPLISLEVSMGLRALELKDNLFDKGTGFGTSFLLEYGERYENTTRPYDYFYISADLNVQASQPLLSHVNLVGRLYSAELLDNDNDFFSIGAYQHFDYYDSDTISSVSAKTPYKIASPATFGVGLVHKSKRFEDWDFNSAFFANGIILGASLSDHYRVRNRNYNIGNGFGLKGKIAITYKDKIGVSGNIEYYHLYTWKGYKKNDDLTVDYHELNIQGDKSSSALTTFNIKAEIKLRKQLYLTAVGAYFKRSTHYKYFEDVYSTTGEGKLMLTYKF